MEEPQLQAPGFDLEAHRRTFLAVLVPLFLGLAVYADGPALRGSFVSDDWTYLVQNPYVQSLSVENVAALLDPTGGAVRYTMNYAPVHLLAHTALIEWFGSNLLLHHLVNVLLHGLTAWLFVLLLASSGLALLPASLAGLVFLVHPANVEAVAMIFQLKTVLSTGLAFAALLLYWRHPFLALLLFALALLTKISAAFALPTVAVLAWARRGKIDAVTPSWAWLGAWLLVLALVAVPELTAFERVGEAPTALHEDPWVRARTLFAIGMRYLVIATTSYGVSAFHQPQPSLSWFDPWWLCGLAVVLLLGTRILITLVRREEEAAYWLMAAASFAPVSQIFPFLYPMADRYLYGILPGLLGGALLAGRRIFERVEARTPRLAIGPWRTSAADIVGLGLALLLVASFASRAHARAWVFLSDLGMMRDAAANYPDGIQANLMRAQEAGIAGDGAAAAQALRSAFEDGWVGFAFVVSNPNLTSVIENPEVKAVVDAMAAHWIEQTRARDNKEQIDFHMLAQAHAVRGELPQAIEAAERGLEQGGPHDEVLRLQLAELKRRRLRQERGPR